MAYDWKGLSSLRNIPRSKTNTTEFIQMILKEQMIAVIVVLIKTNEHELIAET